MSRSQPFPPQSSRRPRSPPIPNDVTNTTQPLSIVRTPSRSITPSSSMSNQQYTSSARNSPMRPARSDLRLRQISQQSQSSTSSIVRDSVSSSPSEAYGGMIWDRQERPKPNGVQGDAVTSPTALNAVLSAFQAAGASRKRAMTNGSLERDREREQEMQEEMQRQRRIRERGPGRRTNGKTKTTGSIDAVLDRIQDDWEFMMESDFNPVDLALQLLDEDAATTGKDLKSFRRVKDVLSNALKGSVDKHYEAFAAALPHHASLVNHLTATQRAVVEARSALQEAKDALGNRRPDLVQLWSRGQTIEEMLRILDQIEHLKSIPDALESLISEKRLLQAAVLLVRNLKSINKQEMLEIGGLSDLRSYLVGQEAALKDILIDELISHIFLKSYWCESRWSAYSPNQRALPSVEYDMEVSSVTGLNRSPGFVESTCPPRLRYFLNDLVTRPNEPPFNLNDSLIESHLHQRDSRMSLSSLTSTRSNGIATNRQKNPEADSFTYIETLLESLAVLGKLGNGLDVVAQRLPTEIYSLVDATLDEVDERAEVGRRFSSYSIGTTIRASNVYVFAANENGGDNLLLNNQLDASLLRLAALEATDREVDHEILRDLFWTLYSKLDAVTQSLRVVYEVSNRIGSRRGFKDSSGLKMGMLFPLNEVWWPIVTEIRALLDDYLLDEEKGAVAGRNPIASINEVLRQSKFNRNKSKQVFRFVDTDAKSTNKTLRQHEDGLNQVLRDTVPGLVQSTQDSAVQTALPQTGLDDRLMGAEHHRLLIRSDAFHIGVLFQPTYSFMERVVEVLPTGIESNRSSTSLLDDFVVNIYLPQLEEKTSFLFHQAVTAPDAFHVDPIALKFSPQPLLKATTQLMALINSLCAMLRTTPFHKENYARLILSVVIQFYQRCSDRFYSIVSSGEPSVGEPRLRTAAKWAQHSDVNACLSEMLDGVLSEKRQGELCAKETRIESGILGDSQIDKADLLGTTRDISLLSSMYYSLTWFVRIFTGLKVTDEITSPNTPYTPQLPVLPPISSGEPLRLPLTKEMALRCDALLKTYEQLAEIILFTIRCDIRCRTIHYLNAAMRFGNYRIDQEDSEPDPHIIDLNADLNQVDDYIAAAVPENERKFIFSGLEVLMEDLLISNSRFIRTANSYGVKKIFRNVLALRQSLKTMSSYSVNAEFNRARQYYNLFTEGPEAMLEGIKKERTFSFEQYRSMLNLQCGLDQGLPQGTAQPSDNNYNKYAIDLHGLEMEYSGNTS